MAAVPSSKATKSPAARKVTSRESVPPVQSAVLEKPLPVATRLPPTVCAASRKMLTVEPLLHV